MIIIKYFKYTNGMLNIQNKAKITKDIIEFVNAMCTAEVSVNESYTIRMGVRMIGNRYQKGFLSNF